MHTSRNHQISVDLRNLLRSGARCDKSNNACRSFQGNIRSQKIISNIPPSLQKIDPTSRQQNYVKVMVASALYDDTDDITLSIFAGPNWVRRIKELESVHELPSESTDNN